MKRLIAQKFTKVNSQGQQAIQYITDSMANSLPISINYKNSGWRTIQPYGWYNSQDNNILLMCKKDNGAIRSYRMDRIYDLYVDDNLVYPSEQQEQDSINNGNNMSSYNIDIAKLPDTLDNIIKETEEEEGTSISPFSDSIEQLDETLNDETNYVEDYQEEKQQYEQTDMNMFGDDFNDLDINNDFEDENVNNEDFDLDNEDSSEEEFDFDLDEEENQ